MLAMILLVITASVTNSFILDGKRIGFQAEFVKSLAVLLCLQFGYFSSSMHFFVLCYAAFTLVVSAFILLTSTNRDRISPA
jgi:hypothetical protein